MGGTLPVCRLRFQIRDFSFFGFHKFSSSLYKTQIIKSFSKRNNGYFSSVFDENVFSEVIVIFQALFSPTHIFISNKAFDYLIKIKYLKETLTCMF